MNITQALAEFPKHADRMDKATRRVRWILRGQLALWLAGALIMTATTAQLIDYDAPWWLITLGVAITVPWAVGAANMRPRFEQVREELDRQATLRAVVDDPDFQLFAQIFTGAVPTSTTVDEEPTPAETPEETKP